MAQAGPILVRSAPITRSSNHQASTSTYSCPTPFPKVLKAGADLTNKDALFTFYFDNSVTPQSGYYQFTPSTLINIVPREYGISIIASDGSAHPKASGKIGSEEPITFEYKVTTSASRQADSITAQVIGDAINMYGLPYCLFTQRTRR